MKKVLTPKKDEVYTFLIQGGSDEVSDITLQMRTTGVCARVMIFVLGKDDEHFDCTIDVLHEASKTKTHIDVYSLATENARIRVHGKIFIPKKSEKVEAFFSHRALLLSPSAMTTSIPSLEIENSDVRAGHAATIGSIDEAALYYLMTRGIKKEHARNMLIEGFLLSGLEHIPEYTERAAITARVMRYCQSLV